MSSSALALHACASALAGAAVAWRLPRATSAAAWAVVVVCAAGGTRRAWRSLNALHPSAPAFPRSRPALACERSARLTRARITSPSSGPATAGEVCALRRLGQRRHGPLTFNVQRSASQAILSEPQERSRRQKAHGLLPSWRMKPLRWAPKKNDLLKHERGVSFEEITVAVEAGSLLEIVPHPNPARYPRQKIMVVEVAGYAYLVPFVEEEDHFFLKTIIPSRKATRNFIAKESDDV